MLFDLGYACARVTTSDSGDPCIILLSPAANGLPPQEIVLDAATALDGLRDLVAALEELESLESLEAEAEPAAPATVPKMPPLRDPFADLDTLSADEGSPMLSLPPVGSLLSQNIPTKKPLTFDDI